MNAICSRARIGHVLRVQNDAVDALSVGAQQAVEYHPIFLLRYILNLTIAPAMTASGVSLLVTLTSMLMGISLKGTSVGRVTESS